MTTIRELCERKEYALAKYAFDRFRGNVPMCCFETRKTGEGPEDYELKCHWLGEWLSPKDFRKKCKKCQLKIAKILETHENED